MLDTKQIRALEEQTWNDLALWRARAWVKPGPGRPRLSLWRCKGVHWNDIGVGVTIPATVAWAEIEFPARIARRCCNLKEPVCLREMWPLFEKVRKYGVQFGVYGDIDDAGPCKVVPRRGQVWDPYLKSVKYATTVQNLEPSLEILVRRVAEVYYMPWDCEFKEIVARIKGAAEQARWTPYSRVVAGEVQIDKEEAALEVPVESKEEARFVSRLLSRGDTLWG